MSTHRKSERGSVIFYILIAVAMFAALNLAVSQMMRDGTAEKISESKAGLYANEVLDYARVVRQTVQGLKISNGCKNEDISFENNVIAGYEHTPVASDDCKVFSLDGGGLSWVIPSSDLSSFGQYTFPGGFRIQSIGVNSEPELLLTLTNMNRIVCEAVNEKIGLGAPALDAAAGHTAQFTGTYNNTARIGNGSGAPMYEGQATGCFLHSTSPDVYVFYQVLIAR